MKKEQSVGKMGDKAPSTQRSFAEVLEIAVARRSVLKGGIGLAVVGIFGKPMSLRAQDSGDPTDDAPIIEFTPITVQEAANQTNWPLVSEDYEYDLIFPWGEPIQPDGPAFTHPPSADNQEVQIGIGHDGMWFFPHPEDIPSDDDQEDDGATVSSDETDDDDQLMNTRGVLVINHEYGSNSRVLGQGLPTSLEEVRASQHAHGVSIIPIEQIDGKWQIVENEKARRIHANTPITFSGPAHDHDLLKNRDDEYEPKGTLNNCANGFTPWGTYLTCEENFHQYFSETPYSTENLRYGLTYSAGDGYGWFRRDSRFRLSHRDYENEGNRFGWVVEIDPHDPEHVPVKHSALGRFRHEGAAVVVGKDDRIAVYMGDDSGNEYIYKYVSAESYKDVLERGESPLADGQLYVARFDDDYTGEWMALSMENDELADRFDDDADMLIHARIAADLLEATKMDRPEWITVAPDEFVYATLTSNSTKTETNAANPESPNEFGHIIKWKDADLHTGTTFEWEVWKLASSTQTTEEMFGNPDGLYADPDGRLFIQTDGGQGEGSREICNQLLVADTSSGEIHRLFTGVEDCEITGIAFTPDRKTMFINVQHPGWDNFESSLSTQEFPGIEGPNVPRDCTVVITKKDGGIVGS